MSSSELEVTDSAESHDVLFVGALVVCHCVCCLKQYQVAASTPYAKQRPSGVEGIDFQG